MSEQLITILIAVITSITTPLVMGWFARRKTQSEAEFNISQAASEIAEGGAQAVDTMTRLLERFEKSNLEKDNKITELEARITSMQIDDTRQIAAMQAKIEGLRGRVAYLEMTLRKSDIPFDPPPDDLLETGKHKAVGK